MFELGQIGLLQSVFGPLEISAGIRHVLVEPQCVESIRFIVVELDRYLVSPL